MNSTEKIKKGQIEDYISVTTQAALDLKAPKVSPIFTGNAVEATGFKVAGTVGLLKSDGSVDTSTHVTGSGASGQISFWNGANSQAGDGGLIWDNANKNLKISGDTYTSSIILPATTGTYYLKSVGAGGAIAFGVDSASSDRDLIFGKTDTFSTFIETARIVSLTNNMLIGKTVDSGQKLQVNGDISATSYKGSADLTGTPTAPTAAAGTDTDQIATTKFVLANGATSGTYTPTIANTLNVTASSLSIATYIRAGNIVTCTLGFSVQPTASGSFSRLTVSLPVTITTVHSSYVGSGSLTTVSLQEIIPCTVLEAGDNTNAVEITFKPATSQAYTGSVSFQYSII